MLQERLHKFYILMMNHISDTYWKVLKMLHIANINLLKVNINNLDIKKKIIDSRIVNNKQEFLIWWQNYPKSQSTFEKEAELRKDGIGNLIDEYLATKI